MSRAEQAHPSAGRRLTYSMLVAPSLVVLLLVNGYPLVYALVQSLHRGSLIATGRFVGLGNYAAVLQRPAFWEAARFTLLFTLVGVFGSWLVGLLLALLLKQDIPGRAFFKVVLMLPWVVPIVVSATSWNWLVGTPQSPLPTLFRVLGLGEQNFFADPTLAVVTVCLFKVWGSFPFMMLMTSSALEAVDGSLYEAAAVDGASPWQRLVNITWPSIARTTFVSWILMTIFCVNDFPTIYLLTGGGPVNSTTSLVVMAYRSVFQDFQTGPGVAIAFILTALLTVVSLVLYRQIQRTEVAA